jgi:hypothetical protein
MRHSGPSVVCKDSVRSRKSLRSKELVCTLLQFASGSSWRIRFHHDPSKTIVFSSANRLLYPPVMCRGVSVLDRSAAYPNWLDCKKICSSTTSWPFMPSVNTHLNQERFSRRHLGPCTNCRRPAAFITATNEEPPERFADYVRYWSSGANYFAPADSS